MDGFAVATLSEAMILCGIGITRPIIILGSIDGQKFEGYQNIIIPTVSTLDELKFISQFTDNINIKINTGMNRIGAGEEELQKMQRYILDNNIRIFSAFTHFFDASNIADTTYQLNEFDRLTGKSPIDWGFTHCAASNCIKLSKEFHKDLVRCGIALYGYDYDFLKPCMEVTCSIVQLLRVNKGQHIGYGRFTAENDMNIATIRIGYGDGYRRITNPRFVCINGTICAVVGQVCMDMTMVDVTSINARIGDCVYIIGDKISCDDLALSYGTINYEVLTSFNERAKKIYFE